MAIMKVIPSATIINIVDVISDIVTAVRAEYDTVNSPAETPYYMHGAWMEIENTLKEKTEAGNELKFKKYPAIILLEDIDSKGADGIFAFKAKLNIVIATNSTDYYKADDRYTNTFDTVLTPLYKLFMKHALRSLKLHKQNGVIQHEPINRMSLGKSNIYGKDATIPDDYVDAIEIKNFDCKIYR